MNIFRPDKILNLYLAYLSLVCVLASKKQSHCSTIELYKKETDTYIVQYWLKWYTAKSKDLNLKL